MGGSLYFTVSQKSVSISCCKITGVLINLCQKFWFNAIISWPFMNLFRERSTAFLRHAIFGKPPIYLHLIFEISSSQNWFFNLIFCLFRTGFLQTTRSKNQVWNRQKIKFKNQFRELEISKIKCTSTGGKYSQSIVSCSIGDKSLRDFYIMTLITGLGCSAIARLALRMIAIRPLSFFLDRKDIILSKDLENATDEGNLFHFLSKDYPNQSICQN